MTPNKQPPWIVLAIKITDDRREDFKAVTFTDAGTPFASHLAALLAANELRAKYPGTNFYVGQTISYQELLGH